MFGSVKFFLRFKSLIVQEAFQSFNANMFNFVLVLKITSDLWMWSTFLYLFLRLFNVLFRCSCFSLPWLHFPHSPPLTSSCFQIFIVSQHGFNPGLINYSLPEAFSVETIARKIKPRFKYRYIRWRNKLRLNWHLLTLKFSCDLLKIGKCLETNSIVFEDHCAMHSCF